MLKIFLSFIVIALVAIGVYTYNSSQNSNLIKTDNERVANLPEDTDQNSRYKIFSEDTLSKSADSRRVLFFYASWCPTCRPVDAEFTKNSDKIPEDVTILRVNYNDPETDEIEKSLAKDYAVTYQHTFVQIDSGGNEITKWNGGGIDNLFANLR